MVIRLKSGLAQHADNKVCNHLANKLQRPKAIDATIFVNMMNNEGKHIQVRTNKDTDLSNLVDSKLTKGLSIGICFLLITIVLIKVGWVGEDSYIGWRMIRNFYEGDGLVWNVGQRIYNFTFPLWLLLNLAAYAFIHNVYLNSIIISLCLTFGAIILFWRKRNSSQIILFTGAFLGSKAITDYVNSGLENPLTNILLAIFYLLIWQPINRIRFQGMILCLSLSFLTRPDGILLFLPAMLYATYLYWNTLNIDISAKIKNIILVGIVGASPALLWMIFALTYFGFVLPNTYYAKLEVPITQLELTKKGILYLFYNLQSDPQTLILISLAIIGGIMSKSKRNLFLTAGIVLHLIYILKIGGDYMSGRFLVAPAFLGIMILADLKLANVQKIGLALFLFSLGFVSSRPPILSGKDYSCAPQYISGEWVPGCVDPVSGLADERGYWFRFSNFLLCFSGSGINPYPLAADSKVFNSPKSRPIRLEYNVGYKGFETPHGEFVFDVFGLCDNVMSRMPSPLASKCVKEWRPGHIPRFIPSGYIESLATGQNKIDNKHLANRFDLFHSIESDPLFSKRRWVNIWRANTEKVDINSLKYPFQVGHNYFFSSALPISQYVDSALSDSLNYAFKFSAVMEPNGEYILRCRHTISPEKLKLLVNGVPAIHKAGVGFIFTLADACDPKMILIGTKQQIENLGAASLSIDKML